MRNTQQNRPPKSKPIPKVIFERKWDCKKPQTNVSNTKGTITTDPPDMKKIRGQ
jgi:hypothetical protein